MKDLHIWKIKSKIMKRKRTGKAFYRSLLMVFLIGPYSSYAQIPQVSLPRPPSMPQYGISTNGNQSNTSQPPTTTHFNRVQQQNEAIMREVQEHERLRQLQTQEFIREAMARDGVALPTFSDAPGTESFYAARDEINDMLCGKRPLSLKRAVFLCENAYFDNRMSYDRFNAEIQNLKKICLLKLKEEGANSQDNMAKNLMIFRVITDEVSVKEPGTEKTLTHYPMKYDFEDFYAREDLSKYMVSKLLVQNTGQCHSLPLLYLILAEELGAKAHLSLSPNHSFIKIQDNQGDWHSLELTRSAIATDDFYMGSGFIRSEALRNKLYLQPLSNKELIAHSLNDLSKYYVSKYGYDEFVKQNADSVLSHFPTNLPAMQTISNYNTSIALYVLRQCNVPSPDDLPQYPQANALYRQMLEGYEKLDNLGYAEMPKEAYKEWLESLRVEKFDPENQPSIMIQTTK